MACLVTTGAKKFAVVNDDMFAEEEDLLTILLDDYSIALSRDLSVSVFIY
jgi:hypothetical protein